MEKMILFSDSTCDLSDELINENNIKIVPLYVSFNENIYKDKFEIKPDQLYSKVKQLGYLPKTSAASYMDFLNAFKPCLEDGYKIIYIGIGSGFSITYNNALMASVELGENNFLIMDSKNLSSSTGLLLLKISKLMKQGYNLKQIKDEIDTYIPLVKCKFVIESLEYLHKGGRCSGVARFFGTLLKLKPIIHVDNGEMDIYSKTKGKRKALELIIKDIVSSKEKIDLDNVIITHTFALKEAQYLHTRLSDEIKNIEKISITEAGCVISSHCGEGTIGLVYSLKADKKTEDIRY